MAETKRIIVDKNKVAQAIKTGLPLTITTYTLPHEMENYMEDVLREFLYQLNQEFMADSLAYCLKELVNNGKKANTKRVYFEEKGLDISNQFDYQKGMLTFKEETINNIRYYLDKQRRNGYYIKLIIQTKNNKIKIEVRNRCDLTVFEYKRIHDKITRAQQFRTVEDGINTLLDDSEGAGLGLVIMILVLRKIGLTEENYQVLCQNGETITRLILPFSKDVSEKINSVSDDFIKLIDGLPEFPENISEINRLISNPNSRMSDIAMKISADVSLTAELLKLVNSAAFALSAPCDNISEAVKLAGLRGIRNLLFSIGTMQNLMVENSDANKKNWDHSYKVAFYAHNLARNFCKSPQDRNCIEDSYVCGLLHDMGKIVFENAHHEILWKINNICKERNVEPSLFETMVAGVNHGEVGSKIAEKWNFPSVLVDVIRYHHEPENAPEEIRKLTAIVYLSDFLVHYSDNEADINQIDTDVLAMFNITSNEQIEGIANRLSKAFHSEK